MSNQTDSTFKTRQELEEKFKVSRATIYRWIKEGHLPPPIRLAANTVRWKTSAIEKFISEKEAL